MPGPRRTSRRAQEARARREQSGTEGTPSLHNAASPQEREAARAQRARTPADLREAQRIRVEQTGRRPFEGDVTGTHVIRDVAPSGARYRVLHNAVGGFAQGAVVHESHLVPHEDRTAAKTRLNELLELEAIELYDQGDEDEEGVYDLDDIAPAPPMTLTEAAYSEDRPTLPRTVGLDVKPGEVREAVRQGVGTSGPRPEEPQDLRGIDPQAPAEQSRADAAGRQPANEPGAAERAERASEAERGESK